jgi:NAD(P)-dependent dehydrogenase (short-subunit alcohol dehydrogenase family)
MPSRLEGKIAVVTGGSAGIGRATALALAEEGAHVVVVGRNAGRLAETAALLQEPCSRFGTKALTLALDVASEPDVERMAAQTLETFGQIDILVAAAGILRGEGIAVRSVADLPTHGWDQVLDINLRGLFLSNRAVLPAMLGRGSGEIVNIASTSGRAGMAFDAAYCASKFGAIGLSEALAEEVADAGVRVQVLLPGPFATDLLHRRWNTTTLPVAYPPPSRVADAIVQLVTLPADTRLVAPVVEPLVGESGGGWQSGRGPERTPRATRSARSQPAPEASPSPGSNEEILMSSSQYVGSRLAGKVVIVTGGTGGIGLATGRAAALEGASIVVADLDQARVDAAVAELSELSNRTDAHLGIALDVRDEADNRRMADATLERFGKIDALIACAGILRKRGTPPKPLVQVTTDEWDEVLDINLKGIFLGNRAVLPTMIKQRSGTIINISSVSGLKGRAHDGPYCASKFGVIGLSQSVADEVRSYGVRVQPLIPDAIDTPIWEQNHPIPRPGDALAPARVADLIVFMLSQPDDTVLVAPVIAPLGARRRQLAGRSAAAEKPVAVPTEV